MSEPIWGDMSDPDDAGAAARRKAVLEFLLRGPASGLTPSVHEVADSSIEPLSVAETLANLATRRATEADGVTRTVARVLDGVFVAFDVAPADDRSAAIETLALLPDDEVHEWFVQAAARADAEVWPALARFASSVPAADLSVQMADAALDLPVSSARDELRDFLGSSPSIRRHIERLQSADRLDQRLRGLELAVAVGDDTAGVTAALSDTSANVRLAAVYLASGTPDRFESRLAELAVDDPSGEVRLASLGLLADADRATRLAVARRALSRPDPVLRKAAVGLLGHDGDDEVALLADALLDESVDVSGRAADVLARTHHRDAPNILWRALIDQERSHRAPLLAAIEALDPSTLTSTLHRAMRSDDVDERALGLQVAARHDHGDEVVEALHEALTDPAVEVRLHAFEALAAHPEAIDVDQVGACVRDPAPAIRLEAVRLLQSLSDDRSFDPLLTAAGDPAEHIRTVARTALLERRSLGLIADLLEALGDPVHRRTARDLLVELDPQTLDPMLDLIAGAGADDAIRGEVGAIIRASGQIDTLTRRLGAREPSTRERALEGLGVAADASVVPAVIACLADPVPSVRRHAVSVLASLGDRRAVAPLRQALVSDPDLDLVPVVEAAIRTLGDDDPDLDAPVIDLSGRTQVASDD